MKAYRIGEKAAATGFDWEKKEDVWAKVKEEAAEVEAEDVYKRQIQAGALREDTQSAQQRPERHATDAAVQYAPACMM